LCAAANRPRWVNPQRWAIAATVVWAGLPTVLDDCA